MTMITQNTRPEPDHRPVELGDFVAVAVDWPVAQIWLDLLRMKMNAGDHLGLCAALVVVKTD